jgi:D-glycero-D-manno-heptose 1,7-bisphosphate phosphatase
MRSAVFLDLNGTLVLPVQAESPGEYREIAGARDAVRQLCAAGFGCPVVTVQSRIAKGVYSEVAFRDWFDAFAAEWRAAGAVLLGPYLCPHRSADGCDCAKPKTRLYLDAAAELGIADLAGSFVVGDTEGDLLAARAIGARAYLVRTGWGPKPGDPLDAAADFVGDDLPTIVPWIIRRSAAPAGA